MFVSLRPVLVHYVDYIVNGILSTVDSVFYLNYFLLESFCLQLVSRMPCLLYVQLFDIVKSFNMNSELAFFCS